ncbi:MAG TPA: hypothetical protein VM347_07880 [Nonomuraea sp.]|nr:hypothetical protein [Nonomuraea sp.]
MHDPRLEDHAVGVELQIVELVEQAERARVQGRDDDARAIEAEIGRLVSELAETAEQVSDAPAESHISAPHARSSAAAS